MIKFILNEREISTPLPSGMTVLDFVRYGQNLKGTKIGCREGDCGACTVLVGELNGDRVKYRTMTSCLMPLANARDKHIVTIEGINRPDGTLTPVQQAMADESGTQCGFCTAGFVVSLTSFCLGQPEKTPEMAVSAIDGNICRCTGYKSIERAAARIAISLSEISRDHAVPDYFTEIPARLSKMARDGSSGSSASLPGSAVPTFVGGGTDVYVQKPDEIASVEASHTLYKEGLRGIHDLGDQIEIGSSTTVTDLLESPPMNEAFPDLYKHLKLVSSTPIRNMATLAGNFVNASPIGDMTVWFLALGADIVLNTGREMMLKQLYLGYKQLAKTPEEYITAIRFKKPAANHYFNFEKVSKRTYLDIATVNTAISLKCEPLPGKAWTPPALSEVGGDAADARRASRTGDIEFVILDAHLSAGGVAPIPLFLKETSSFLVGRMVGRETFEKANQIMQLEISPISDVRGTEEYKRLLLRQLLRAHFVELFGEHAV